MGTYRVTIYLQTPARISRLGQRLSEVQFRKPIDPQGNGPGGRSTAISLKSNP